MVKCSSVRQRGIADARGEVFNRKAKGNCRCALMLAGGYLHVTLHAFTGFTLLDAIPPIRSRENCLLVPGQCNLSRVSQ